MGQETFWGASRRLHDRIPPDCILCVLPYIDVLSSVTYYSKAPQDCATASLTPTAALAGAKYTIGAKDDGSNHSSSNSSDSELGSDSEPSDSDLDLEDSAPTAKKHKVKNGKGKAVVHPTPSSSTTIMTPSTPPAAAPASLTPNQVRENYMRQHRELAEQLRANFEEKYPDLKKAEPKKRVRKAKDPTTGPTQKSQRVIMTVPDYSADGNTSAVPAVPRLTPRPRQRPTTQKSPPATAAGDAMDVDDANNAAASSTPTPAMSAPTQPVEDSTEAAASSTSTAMTPTLTHDTDATTISVPTAVTLTPVASMTPAPVQPRDIAPTTVTTPAQPLLALTPQLATMPSLTSMTMPQLVTAQSPTLPVSVAPKCLPNAATWFVDAHAQMTKVELGCHFHALIAAWVWVEAASRYEQGPSKLSTINRPVQVKNWIAKERGKQPCDTSVPDPVAYAAGWQVWWDSLQPAWRTKDAEGAWSVSSDYGDGGKEWGPLFQWGQNGILNIVASLYFWGVAVRESTPELQSVWEECVLDVVWMLEGLATYYEMWNCKF
jgi:hypothetical protein